MRRHLKALCNVRTNSADAIQIQLECFQLSEAVETQADDRHGCDKLPVGWLSRLRHLA